MKTKIIFFVIALFFFKSNSFASHLMGGQITAKQISGLQYEVKLVLYRDANPSSATLGLTVDLTLKNNQSAWTVNRIGHLADSSSVMNGVEEYIYIDTVVFPGPGNYTVDWNLCCRNGAIINMASPSAESIYLNTIVQVDNASSNSTPIFLNQPVTIAQLNNLFSYNPLPYDADGDSLAWTLVTPLSFSNLPVNGYLPPHSNSAFPFTLNNISGEITWMPDMLGNFVSSFLVEEYRGGIKIGEIRRDMQVIVINDTTNSTRASFATSGWPVNQFGAIMFSLPVDSTFTLTLVANDDVSDMLRIEANGAPFSHSVNPANYLSTPGLGQAVSVVSWTPNSAQIQSIPYTVAFRIMEQHGNFNYASDKTVLINVINTVGIKEVSTSINTENIYPNPSEGSFCIPFNLTHAARVKIEVLNTLGEVATILVDKAMNSGKNVVLATNLNLTRGMYSVDILIDGNKVSTKKLVITE